MYFAPGGGTVSVFAYDEANYPVDTVTEPEDLDELPFSLDELRESNRITNLLNKYGTLVLENTTEYGDYTTSNFRRGDVIVRYSYMEFTGEDGTVYRQGAGNYGREEFELNGDGDDLPAHDTFAADQGEYAVDVLFEAYAKVSDFRVYSLKSEGFGEDGQPIFSGTELYRYAAFTPEKALLLTLTFGEILPTYGFSYKDAAGNTHIYGVVESGMDGSAVLVQIRIAVG